MNQIEYIDQRFLHNKKVGYNMYSVYCIGFGSYA